MYMSLFRCRCKQPLIKPDEAQIKQRWSKTKTTTYQQKIEDDRWGQHVKQGGGPTPPCVGQRPTFGGPPPGPHSHQPQHLLEAWWGPHGSNRSVDWPVMWAHLKLVHSHRHPHDEHVMEIPNHWAYGGSMIGLIQRWRSGSTRITDVALE